MELCLNSGEKLSAGFSILLCEVSGDELAFTRDSIHVVELFFQNAKLILLVKKKSGLEIPETTVDSEVFITVQEGCEIGIAPRK